MKQNKLLIAGFILLAAATQLQAQNINKPNIQGPAGLEVNSFSGSLFTKRTDLMIPGRGLSIDLTFYYNSSTTALDFGYGAGWSMTYTMLCKPDSNKVIVRQADGRKDIYTKSGNTYVAPVGIFDSLTMYQQGKFKLRTKYGISYFFDDSTYHRLTSISDPNSNTITLSYTDSLITSITDASGRIVSLNYTSGHLTDITDVNTTPARHIIFTNDAHGSPVTITDPSGNSIQYQYDPVRNITKLTDELANQFNIVYSNCEKVSGITSPLNSLTIAMDTALKKTTVTEMVNSVSQSTSYTFDPDGNIAEKIGNCCGYHVTYAYDAMKNVIQRTDANGNSTNFSYDTKGNVTSETDALNHTSSFSYEPVYNRITSSSDKNSNITSFSYDAQGNLLQVNKPLGITEHFTYDAFGNTISSINGNGNTTQFQYNANGDQTIMTLPGGSIVTNTYDNAGNKISSTDANAHTTLYVYDQLNRLTQVTDALGHTSTFGYDARGSRTSATDALGHTKSFVYDALFRVISTTTPAGTSSATYDEKGNTLTYTDNKGNVSHYTYNTQNLPSMLTDALNHSRTFTYNANGNKLTETDFSAHPTTYTYDALNRLTQVTDALSHNTAFAYDANGNRTSVTDANGHTTSVTYDALNRKTQVQMPVGTTQYVYDADGNTTSVTDANGHSSLYVYDNRDRLVSETDPLSHATLYAYDAQSNLTSETDRNGHATTYTYDALNRATSTLYPLSFTHSATYDAVGKATSETMPNGDIKTYTYDASNRLLSASDQTGLLISYTYDANSLMTAQTDANGNTTSYTYDGLNRLTTTTDASAHTINYAYNNNSNIISETDRNGNTTTYGYDVLERRISTTQPGGNSTSVTYDAIGNTLTKTDDNNHTTSYTYDANNRLVTETFADATAKTYLYDTRGNWISRTDQNGNTTAYVYDASDRLTTRNYPGSNDDTFTYDNENRMNSAANSHAVISLTYDNADQLLSETLNGKTTSYAFDIPNRKRTLTYPGGRTIEEDYDYRARLTSIKESSTPVASYTYDAANRITNCTYSNGAATTYAYNTNNWLTGITHTGSSAIAQFNYSFDNNGNRLNEEKVHHATNSEKYSYDANNRLVNYKAGTLSGGNIPTPLTQTQYNYDGVNNRSTIVHDAVTTTYTANTVNEYTTIADSNSISPVHDANGNVVNDGTHTYTYDFENRLISVDGGVTASYKYDALGRRIQKITSAGTINYYYDSQWIVEERDAADAVTATYINGADIDNTISMRRSGADYFYHYNSLGSVIALTDNTGATVERYEYNAYGKPSFYNNAYASLPSSAIGNTYLFTGREYDAETGNYYYRARTYNPNTGRFMQQDPIGNWGDGNNNGNGFAYVGNNPVNGSDPMGLFMVVGRHGRGGKLECICADGAGFNSEDNFGPGYDKSDPQFPRDFGNLCRGFCTKGHHGMVSGGGSTLSGTDIFTTSYNFDGTPFSNPDNTQSMHIRMLSAARECREKEHLVAQGILKARRNQEEDTKGISKGPDDNGANNWPVGMNPNFGNNTGNNNGSALRHKRRGFHYEHLPMDKGTMTAGPLVDVDLDVEKARKSLGGGMTYYGPNSGNDNSTPTSQGPRIFLSPVTPDFDSGNRGSNLTAGNGIPDVDVGLKKRTPFTNPTPPPPPPKDWTDDVIDAVKSGWKWLTGG